MELEASYLRAVNPHEVNPIVGDTSPTTEYQLNFNVTNVAVSASGAFYDLPQVKLEMEEFKDLSVYLPNVQAPTLSSNSIDELNTPVFDKEAFNFSMLPTVKPSSPFTFKSEYDHYHDNQFMYNKDLTTRPQVLHHQSTFNNLSNNSNNIQQQPTNSITTNYTLSPTETSNGNMYNSSDCESPPYEPIHSFAGISSTICTPEDSNSSNHSHQRSPPHLYLNTQITSTLSQISNSLNTPDVIDSVVALDGNFNILDLVRAEDIPTVNAEDIFPLYNSIQHQLHDTYPSTSQCDKPQRRKHKYSDDDEDYQPPVKSRRHYAEGSTSADSDSDYDSKPAPKKRGRAGRKASSATSNDGEVSRYRDLRDKNNEASRKSRMKRKQKEVEVEKECDELSERNIKLKAQVDELEKTVSSYRENLFKIMLKK